MIQVETFIKYFDIAKVRVRVSSTTMAFSGHIYHGTISLPYQSLWFLPFSCFYFCPLCPFFLFYFFLSPCDGYKNTMISMSQQNLLQAWPEDCVTCTALLTAEGGSIRKGALGDLGTFRGTPFGGGSS